ncbi:MAG TPA: sugar phosphate isomerase/epimerase family protein [Gemmataceae bacterium]|nr:sugar phosphate isomerase/epimerase family protein [Gemmataceae bacterium]
MQYVYFTKSLKELDVKGVAAFCKEVGVDGVDLTVRKGYPVNPDNAATALPEAVKLFKDSGLILGLVSIDTDVNDPDSKTVKAVFDACAKAEAPAVKIGYFPYKPPFDDAVKDARSRLTGFAKLAEQSKLRACYHTHSGANLGNNCACLRTLLQDLDPHHVGAYVDTGHTAVNGGPIRMELDIIRPWLSMLAIKDMLWSKDDKKGWKYDVVPAGDGIVRWDDVALAVKESKFNGTISLHAEYETKDMDERKALAKRELEFLKKLLG